MGNYYQTKKWRQKSKKNRAYGPKYMREKRRAYRIMYDAGKVAYEDIPKSYRCFRDTRKIKKTKTT